MPTYPELIAQNAPAADNILRDFRQISTLSVTTIT